MEENKNVKDLLSKVVYFNLDMLEIKAPGIDQFMNDTFTDDEGVMMTLKKGKGSNSTENTGMDDDNSSENYLTLYGLDFSYTEGKANGYEYSYVFSCSVNGKPLKAFTFLIGRKGFISQAQDGQEIKHAQDISKISFYSGFFAAERLGVFPFTIAQFYEKYFSRYKDVSRFDICMDINATKPEILPLFDKVTKWKSSVGDDEKHPGLFQTYYMGEVRNDSNHYRLFRLYDKQADSWKKKKVFLFPHLLEYENIQRLEIEFRRELCKKLGKTAIELLTSEELQRQLFHTYISTESSYFEKYEFEYVKQATGVSFIMDYLKPVPDKYLSQYCSFVSKIASACSYKGLCQLLLQPTRKVSKFKKIGGEYVELEQTRKVYAIKGKNFEEREKYVSDTLQTVIDPLALLDTYIRYLHEEIHIPVSKINAVLKRRYIRDTRNRKLVQESREIFA